MRRAILRVVAVLAAGCGGPGTPPLPGPGDPPDAGVPVPVVQHPHSLFWTDPALLDDASLLSFAQVMAELSPDGHGGRLLDAWFRRFATTAHSERAQPQQLIDELALAHGADPAGWPLEAVPFRATGVHNRIDLAAFEGPEPHCGELRVSFASEHPVAQPLHVLVMFRQPLGEGDVWAGVVTCEATARDWASLSELAGAPLVVAVRARLSERLIRDRFLMIETVELTVSPWEWRQWAKVADPLGELPFVLDNPPLFQTVDADRVNAPGPTRDAFLAFVAASADALDARTAPIPEAFRRPSARVAEGVARTPVDLSPLPAALHQRLPRLRQQLDLVGCPACHTADADFVHTRADRTVSPFYEKELLARERHLEALARGEAPRAPFGPLQQDPVLPQ